MSQRTVPQDRREREADERPAGVSGEGDALAVALLALLERLGARAEQDEPLEPILDRGVEAVVGGLAVDLAAIFELPLDQPERAVMRAGRGWREGVVGVPCGLRSAPSETRLDHIDLHDTPSLPAADRWPDVLFTHAVRAGMSIDLGGTLGSRRVLMALWQRPRSFTPLEVSFVRCVANALAGAIVRHTTQEDLLRSLTRLRSIQKMEAIGRLAGGIAHDFNNLIQAIAGFNEGSLKDLPPDHALRRNAEGIRKAGDRAAALTRQLLAFSRQQVLQPTVVDLNRVVVNMHELLSAMIGERIEIRTALAPNLAPIKADVAQLEQVLMNLAVNAAHAMPDGGVLTVGTETVELPEPGSADPFVIPQGQYVRLTVVDDGCGMDPETRARAFEPFFTTKPQGEGTGLGLSTVYGIVKQSGGYIWMDSEVGRGTRARICLPRVDEAVHEEAPRRPAPAHDATGSETVLLVEDEDAVRELISDWLQTHGYVVLSAPDGQAALEVSRGHRGRIDVLVADVVMPRIGGPALARAILGERPALKVIFVSGYADAGLGDHRVLDSAAAFLQKPFALDDLVRKVREMLDAPAGPGGKPGS